MRFLHALLRWNKPLAYRGLLLTDLKRFVETFLHQLRPGSVLLLERETKPGFLQLAISERRDQWREVEFGLPDAEWSHSQFDVVHAAMQSAGYSTEIEINEGNEQVPRFLRVYVEGNREDLTITLLQLLETAANKLEFAVEDRYTLQMMGETAPEYTRELATQLEQLPRGGWFTNMLGKYLRRSANRPRQ
jgi:hypothetical protein